MNNKTMYIVGALIGAYLIFKPKAASSLTFNGTLGEGPRSDESDSVTDSINEVESYISKLYSRRSSRQL